MMFIRILMNINESHDGTPAEVERSVHVRCSVEINILLGVIFKKGTHTKQQLEFLFRLA